MGDDECTCPRCTCQPAQKQTNEAELLASYMAVGMTASEAYQAIIRALNAALADVA